MKKVLFISPNFFNYSEIIKNKLISNGYEVDWFDDRPSTNVISKCLLRVNRNLLKNKIKRYFYNNIYKSMEEKKYDIVFVILGQSFNQEMFNDLRKVNKDAKYVLYLWDSVKNFPHILDLSKAFDVTYSFDTLDCEKYGFNFLPLFYNEEKKNDSNIEYDVTFIGTIKKGKLSQFKKIEEQLNKKYSNNFFYLYLQSKLVFLYNKFLNKEFKNAKMNDFKYNKLTYKDNNQIMLSSNIILDIPMSNQNGLSMRTFECLGYHKKLITTNENVLKYDFYKEENIYYYNGQKIDFDNIFFKSDYIELEEEILNKYSLDNFISILFK